MQRVTASDVAQLAGVSQATVSRALRGSSLVSAETSERVRRIAAESNYRVDCGASRLRSRRARTIALLLHDDSEMGSDINPFFLSMLAATTKAAAARNYDVLLSFQQLGERSPEDYETSNKADGVIMLGYGGYTDYIRKIATLEDVHCVTWGPVIDGQPGHFVGCDNLQGGYIATRHLLGLGHTRIAFIGDICNDRPEFQARHAGYRRALTEAGLRVGRPRHGTAAPSVEGGYEAAQKMLESGASFTAVFCATDLNAIGTMRALADAGLRVPDDVSVVGFDDVLSIAHTTPSLTTVRQDTARAGEVLVDALLDVIRGDAAKSRLLEPELIVRESSSTPNKHRIAP